MKNALRLRIAKGVVKYVGETSQLPDKHEIDPNKTLEIGKNTRALVVLIVDSTSGRRGGRIIEMQRAGGQTPPLKITSHHPLARRGEAFISKFNRAGGVLTLEVCSKCKAAKSAAKIKL